MGEYPYEGGGGATGHLRKCTDGHDKVALKGYSPYKWTNPPEILGTCRSTQMNIRKLSSIYKHYQLKRDNYMTN